MLREDYFEDESVRYIESVAKTNKLWCSDCNKKIKQGENVVFVIYEDNKIMKEVFCSKCGEKYFDEIIDSQRHPLDLDDGYYEQE